MANELESEPLASITSALLDADYMLSGDAQNRVLKVLRTNLAQEKLDAEASYTLTHKEIIMLILKREVARHAFPGQPTDDSILEQKLVTARRQKEAVEAIERRQAAWENLDLDLDWLDTEIKMLLNSLPPEPQT